MAAQQDIDQTIQLLGPDAPTNGWDDNRVGADLDSGMTKEAIALAWWQARMAQLSSMVDVSEGGSTRSNSQAWQHAQQMANYFQGLVDRQQPVVNAITPLRSYTMRRV